MKLYKVGILTYTAILAFMLSAYSYSATNGGRILVRNCYRQMVAAYNAACFVSPFNLQPGLTCEQAQIQHGKGLSVPSPSGFMAITECPIVKSFFCCAQLTVDPTPCSNQPYIPSFIDGTGGTRINQKAQISAIFCKDIAN